MIAYVVTYRICLGLQHSDRAVLEHGIETGVIKRLPSGEFIEVHQPLGPVDDHGHADAAGLPGRRGAQADEPARVRRARRCRASLRPVDDSGHISYDDELHPPELEAGSRH